MGSASRLVRGDQQKQIVKRIEGMAGIAGRGGRYSAWEGNAVSRQKNMRRISVLVTAQTAHNLGRLAAMDGGNEGRVIDKLVRDRMVMLKEAERMVRRHE